MFKKNDSDLNVYFVYDDEGSIAEGSVPDRRIYTQLNQIYHTNVILRAGAR